MEIQSYGMEKRDFCGKIILPGSPWYDTARQEWNRSIQKFPAAIIYCTNEEDVRKGIHYAKRHGLPVRVRSGGHNYEGFSVGNRALVIDTSCMKDAEIDTERGTAEIGGGVNNRELYELTGAEGYPFPSGTCPTVGASGITLGGGWGYSARMFGLTCDSLLEVKMVDARERLLTASGTELPSLFWASRGGGGGNFGVVTSLTYRLPPKFFDVTLVEIEYHDASERTAVEFFSEWQSWLEEGDRRFSPGSRIFNSEEEGMGVFMRGIFYGTPEEAVESLRPFLEIDSALSRFTPLTFTEAIEEIESLYPPFELFRFAGRFVFEKYSRDTIRKIIRMVKTRAQGSVYASVALYALGGKVGEIPPEGTAFFYRGAKYIMGIETVWEDPKFEKFNLEWIQPRFEYLESITCGSYINFPYLRTPDYMEAYYGGNARRLRKIKSIYDPHNIFLFPQSIR